MMKKLAATVKKSMPSTIRHGRTIGSFIVRDRGAVVVSQKTMQSLERYGAKYGTALKSLAKR